MESFHLPVDYKGREYNFETTLQRAGYVYKFHVMIHGQEIIFEADEEKNYRAVIPYGQSPANDIDVELLKTIADTLEELAK